MKGPTKAPRVRARPQRPAAKPPAPPQSARPPRRAATEVVDDALRDRGTPLEPPVRSEMEARFEHDFTDVRVHDGPAAATAADALGAEAFTSGLTLLSARALAALREHAVRGLQERRVVAAGTGAPSEHVAQVEPERWVSGVCPEHSGLEGEQCPKCGRVLGRLGGPVHLRRDEVGDADVVGRRAGVRLVYFSRRVRQILEDVDANGLLVGDPIYLCDHS